MPVKHRTTSATVYIRGWTYIFLNVPGTDHIDWYRFTSARDVSNGKIANLKSKTGPISALVFDDGSIRLYFAGPVPDSARRIPGLSNLTVVREAKLCNAHLAETNPSTDWVENVGEVDFEQEVYFGSRLLDETSFLSASFRVDETPPHWTLPTVTFKLLAEDDYFYYMRKRSDGSWESTRLKFPKESKEVKAAGKDGKEDEEEEDEDGGDEVSEEENGGVKQENVDELESGQQTETVTILTRDSGSSNWRVRGSQ